MASRFKGLVLRGLMPDPRPHDAWAEVYDLVYAEEFGALLEGLTDRTLELVRTFAKPPAAVVDFGAGTGRLAIPLASAGYRVVAVEPSAPMLDRLAGKPGGDAVRRVVGRMQDYAGDMRFDLALCVFTVLSYLTTRAQLDAGLSAVRASLEPTGKVLLDLPHATLFRNRDVRTSRVVRSVRMDALGEGLFAYRDRIEILDPPTGRPIRHFEDSFEIRAWSQGELEAAAARAGLRVEADVSHRIPGAGASWLVLTLEAGRGHAG